MERISQPIRIAAIFTPDRQIRPVWFDWNNRKHTIVETCYFWKEKNGNATLFHFSVRDEGALYELIYNTTEQSWTLDGIEVT
ncbi:MAG: hypothetical protein PHY09_03855 [Desulfuromonadaceae bacterium]|nr:hypothetical protein [Desulfuromonadaceae bacterium]MDD5106693.1 hypothetical protein [Desulfuromonadaceae bacterium]